MPAPRQFAAPWRRLEEVKPRQSLDLASHSLRSFTATSVRVRPVPHRALVNRAAQRLGRAASILRARATELLAGALGKGSRRHQACRRRYHCPVPGALLTGLVAALGPRAAFGVAMLTLLRVPFLEGDARPWRAPDQGPAASGRLRKRLRVRVQAGFSVTG